MKTLHAKCSALLLLFSLLSSCKLLPGDADPAAEARLSQFERAGYSDLLIDKSGNYHAVFLESPDNGKPVFVYYTHSEDQGKSWSAAESISNDGSGNGSGHPRLIQDGNGTIYAVWKRYGSTKTNFPTGDVNLEGPGGYVLGTLFYSILNGGKFGTRVMLAEDEAMQLSWFPALDQQGKLHIIWSQTTAESKRNYWNSGYHADWVRDATINGNSATNVISYTVPANPPANNPTGEPTKAGFHNLRGYFDPSGKIHFIAEVEVSGIRNIAYYDGKSFYTVYKYPQYHQLNTFMNPPNLLRDERGIDHIVMLPPATTLESEQVWDLDVSIQKFNIIASIQKKGLKIQGFQAHQGPNGEMAVTIQAGGLVESNESYGLFYKNGKWVTKGLTNNASKESFSYAEFSNFNGRNTYLTTLEQYTTKYIKVAWDGTGKKSMLMTLSADFAGLGYSVSNPSIIFSSID